MTHISFADYAATLTTTLCDTYVFRNSAIQIDVKQVTGEVRLEQAIPLGMIMGELVTNSLKHAFKDGRGGKIEVSFNPIDGGKHVLVVKDDGIGIPSNAFNSSGKSLGLSLVRIFVEQLH